VWKEDFKRLEIFSLGTKVRSNIDLHDQGGHAIQILLAKSEKTVNAKAPTDISQAKIKRAMILYLYFVVNNVEAR
jgi:hypothetical protein